MCTVLFCVNNLMKPNGSIPVVKKWRDFLVGVVPEFVSWLTD
jgi:hypothetical protein